MTPIEISIENTDSPRDLEEEQKIDLKQHLVLQSMHRLNTNLMKSEHSWQVVNQDPSSPLERASSVRANKEQPIESYDPQTLNLIDNLLGASDAEFEQFFADESNL